jgi:hypothetical protein
MSGESSAARKLDWQKRTIDQFLGETKKGQPALSNNFMLQGDDRGKEGKLTGPPPGAQALYASKPSTVHRKQRAKTNLRGASGPAADQ